MKYPLATLALCSIALGSCGLHEDSEKITADETGFNPALWPTRVPPVVDTNLEQRITQLMASMTIEQKVGQLIQPEIRHVNDGDMQAYFLGSVLNGGGSFPQQNKHATLNDWLALADQFYLGSMQVDATEKIPAIWGTDAVHGHNNVIGATLFPHNIALGAAHNPDLIEAIGAATAREMAATGISWSFAPTIAVARDDRWGRTYESYSEKPELVSEYARAMVTGLQGKNGSPEFMGTGKVIATAKHFIADGGTDSGVDRGDAAISEAELVAIHAPGYFAALDAGVQVVMASFSSWQGDKLHGHHYLLTDILKHRLGFDGFVVGDWAGHAFVPGCTDTRCPEAINAGVDMLMAPDANWRELYQNTVADARAGSITAERIDDAVRRILRVKLRAGVFEKGKPSSYPLAAKTELIGAAEHRAIARQAVRQSLVLLKNQQQLLPLAPNSHVLIAGDGADNIGKQTGGWTISWQGTGNSNIDFPGATSIYQGIEQRVSAGGGTATLSVDGSYTVRPDAAIVVFGENPYAEMQGDSTDLGYRAPDDLALLKKFQAEKIPVIGLFITGRPLAINAYLNATDAMVVVWQPGTEGAGVADVLFTKTDGNIDFPFTGQLSFSWPRTPQQAPQNIGDPGYDPMFAVGYGLSNGEPDPTSYPLPTQESDVKTDLANLLPLFQRRAFAPWTQRLIDSAQQPTDINGASLKVPGLQMRAIDRYVQEDAIALAWNGVASQGFFSDQPVDLSRFAQGSLVFDVRLDNPAPVQISLTCTPDCSSQPLDQYADMTRRDWQQVRVPLACFSKDLTQVDAAFQITGDAGTELALYNVYLETGDQHCPH